MTILQSMSALKEMESVEEANALTWTVPLPLQEWHACSTVYPLLLLRDAIMGEVRPADPRGEAGRV